MRRFKLPLYLAGLALVASGFGGLAIERAWATPAADVTTTILAGPVPFDEIDAKCLVGDDYHAKIKTKGPSDVYIVLNVIKPGGTTGWHSHPGISFVTVKSGTVTEDEGSDPSTPHTYSAGSGLVEEAGRVHRFRNETSANVELVAFQIIPSGATRRVDEPAP